MSTAAAMKTHVAASQAALYGIKPNGDGDLAGSGAFVRVGDAVCGVTAAHVMNDRISRGENVAHSVSPGTRPALIVSHVPVADREALAGAGERDHQRLVAPGALVEPGALLLDAVERLDVTVDRQTSACTSLMARRKPGS